MLYLESLTRVQPFSIYCVEDQDNIYTLKQKIREKKKKKMNDTAAYRLILYSPVVQLNIAEKFKVEDGEKLHPRRVITSDPPFPESKDPAVDIVAVVDGDATPGRNQERPRPQRLSSENDLLLLSSLLTL